MDSTDHSKNMNCQSCSRLQKELYEARLTIARQEGALAILKATSGIASERVSFAFLRDTCDAHFTPDVLRGGPRSYASYVLDHVAPGRVAFNRSRKTARYVADDGNTVEEPVADLVAKILASTRVRADLLYASGRDPLIADFCQDADSRPIDLARCFSNMALVRNCNPDFCREVASIILRQQL